MMKQIYAMKLLVVDDNLELLQMIQTILIQAGFQNIVTASNCQQARQIFTRQQLDGAVPVSYTHLDVYKRQPYSSQINSALATE